MVDTVGKKLHKARLQKKVSVEDAARATRIRPDRLVDLENDNYTNFPSLAYAKGFLTMYGRYLNVDVSEFAHALDSSSQVGMGDYEYLHHGTETEPAVEPRKKSSMVVWWLIGILVVVVGGFALYGAILFKRLEAITTTSHPSPTPAPLAGATPATAAPQLSIPVAPAVPADSPAPFSSPIVEEPPADLPVRKAVPIAPGDVAAAAARAAAVPANHTLVLKAKKRGFVKVQTDVNSAPVFEDWLTPDSAPLTLDGPRFWVFLRDPESVEITRDGEPITYEQADGIWIQ